MRPDLASAWHLCASALSRGGRSEEALPAYDRAITLASSNPQAHNGRGNTLYDLGRYGDALAAYEQAITLTPSFAVAHSNRANVLWVLGRHGDALAAYDQAINLAPRDAVPHANKGMVLAEAGDLRQALAELETARRLDPKGAGQATAWAAAILWHQSEPAQARDLFTQVEGRVTMCTPFCTAETEAIALCGLGEPGNAEERLLGAIHLRIPGDRDERRVIYDLLSDPPLSGIDRLRTIAERQD
jgi:tetratricopeptide (TPR) repeat protein